MIVPLSATDGDLVRPAGQRLVAVLGAGVGPLLDRAGGRQRQHLVPVGERPGQREPDRPGVRGGDALQAAAVRVRPVVRGGLVVEQLHRPGRAAGDEVGGEQPLDAVLDVRAGQRVAVLPAQAGAQGVGPGPAAVGGPAGRGGEVGDDAGAGRARLGRERDQLAGVEAHDVPDARRVRPLRVEAVDGAGDQGERAAGPSWTAAGPRCCRGRARAPPPGPPPAPGRRGCTPPAPPHPPTPRRARPAPTAPGGGRVPVRWARRGHFSWGAGRAARQMAANSSPSRLAPPTSAPSTSGLRHQLGRVARLHRAAVEDPHPVGEVARVALGEHGAQLAAHLLGVVRASRPGRCRSPRPARTRPRATAACSAGSPRERRVQLGRAVRDVTAGVADVRLLADAEDRGHAVARRPRPTLAATSVVGPRRGTAGARSGPTTTYEQPSLASIGPDDVAGVGALVVLRTGPARRSRAAACRRRPGSARCAPT